jgi:Cd2+/Zn2+-exporting ATPase
MAGYTACINGFGKCIKIEKAHFMNQQTFIVKGMDCADCALKIEKGVRQVDGIASARVDFATGLLHVEGQASPEAVQRRVQALGYGLEERITAGRTAQAKPASGGALAGFWRYLLARPETRLALAGGALLLLSALAQALGLAPGQVRGVQMLALAVAGYPVARSALAALWINRDFSINLLMTIAAIGAVIIGDTAESATLIFLFAISEALEGYTADRARRVLGEMSALSPSSAVRITPGSEEVVPVEALRVNDEILVRAGERIPMDGVILSGNSAVNQAPITGESLPAEKTPGDAVFAGTVNGGGALTVRVTRRVEDTTIQRIIRMIEQAQSVRAPTQRFIDRFAQVYTPLMVLVALLVAAIPPLFFGQPFLNTPAGVGWLYRALALLVIACPCALVISAPVTIISAITAGARRGVLFKGGAFLEALAAIKVFAFDKTGTLTNGAPVVTAFRAVDCPDPAPADSAVAVNGGCAHCNDVLALASALERRSAHPLAGSVVSAAAQLGLAERYPAALDVVTLAGSGLQGTVNGKRATIGSHPLFEREHPHQQSLCGWVEAAEDQGQTTMLVCDGDRVRGFIAVADTLRDSSQGVIAEIHALGKQTAMLTGDNPAAARAIAAQLGIDHVRAGLLPEDKVAAVRELGDSYGQVAMIGDGINDTPALAASALGIAMGGAGSAQALETADIVLMGGDLRQLPFAVRLSRFARRLIRQNVIISLGAKLVFILLAMAGLTSLWLAVLADVGVSLVVTLNGLRANRYS